MPSFRLITSIAALVAATAGVAACSSSTHGAGSAGSSSSGPSSGSSASATASPTATSASSSSAAPTTPPSSSGSGGATGPAGGPVPAGFTPSSASFVSSTDGWVLGTAPCSTQPCTSVVRTRDGGRTWQGIPAPKAGLGRADNATAADVSTIRFATTSDGWAAGGALYSTHDGGATWTKVAIGPSGATVTALETGGGYVYAAVDTCPLSSGCNVSTTLYASPIGHDQFVSTGLSVHAGVQASQLAVHGADWFLAPTPGTAIYHGQGTGHASSVAGPSCGPSGEFGLAAIAAADATHLDVMCSGDGAAGSASFQLYGTSDGGAHWLKSGPSHVLASGLSAMSDSGQGALLVALASGASRLYRTTDDGQSFTAVLNVASGGQVWGDAGYTTSTQAFAVLAGSAFYLSRDSGATWSKVSF